MKLLLVLLPASLFAAANLGPDLLSAARKGQAARIRALLDRGAPIESQDKDGRTALMLAAQHGHVEAVELLREAGANPGARDPQGWTAYGLALLSSSPARPEVLKLLPQPAQRHVVLDVRFDPENLYSSCTMPPAQLAKFVAELHPENMVLDAIRQTAASPGISPDLVPVTFVPSDGDATAAVRARPQVSCVQQQSADNVSLAIDLRVNLNGRQSPLVDKTFGGGLKGLHVRRATSPVQYSGLFAEWARSHAGEVYWAIVAALLRAGE